MWPILVLRSHYSLLNKPRGLRLRLAGLTKCGYHHTSGETLYRTLKNVRRRGLPSNLIIWVSCTVVVILRGHQL
jgi:hypothetical protein